MAAETGIEWCDSTFNPWIGCTHDEFPSASCARLSAAQQGDQQCPVPPSP